MIVLDASALLAVLQAESGKDHIADRIDGALMSAVNYSEVLKRMIQGGMPLHVVKSVLNELNFKVISLDAKTAEIAASLWFQTKEFGLSLADRCCLALGIVSEGTILTADRALMQLNVPVRVELVRHRGSPAFVTS